MQRSQLKSMFGEIRLSQCLEFAISVLLNHGLINGLIILVPSLHLGHSLRVLDNRSINEFALIVRSE